MGTIRAFLACDCIWTGVLQSRICTADREQIGQIQEQRKRQKEIHTDISHLKRVTACDYRYEIIASSSMQEPPDWSPRFFLPEHFEGARAGGLMSHNRERKPPIPIRAQIVLGCSWFITRRGQPIRGRRPSAQSSAQTSHSHNVAPPSEEIHACSIRR